MPDDFNPNIENEGREPELAEAQDYQQREPMSAEPTPPVSQPDDEAYARFEEKESRLLDHWYAPVVARKAHAFGFEAGLAERDRELQQARAEIARLKEALARILWTNTWHGAYVIADLALHPVPEKPKS